MSAFCFTLTVNGTALTSPSGPSLARDRAALVFFRVLLRGVRSSWSRSSLSSSELFCEIHFARIRVLDRGILQSSLSVSIEDDKADETVAFALRLLSSPEAQLLPRPRSPEETAEGLLSFLCT
jgi:hypothetical protein